TSSYGDWSSDVCSSDLNAFHRRALEIALLVGAPAAVLQPLSGDLSARHIAVHQPVKLAAAEALFRTQPGAPLTLVGWPDVAVQEIGRASCRAREGTAAG